MITPTWFAVRRRIFTMFMDQVRTWELESETFGSGTLTPHGVHSTSNDGRIKMWTQYDLKVSQFKVLPSLQCERQHVPSFSLNEDVDISGDFNDKNRLYTVERLKFKSGVDARIGIRRNLTPNRFHSTDRLKFENFVLRLL